MAEQREGLFTPDQEELIDELLKFKNPVAEAADGMGIRIADNKGLQVAKEEFLKKFPDAEQGLYKFVDDVMNIVAELA